MATTAGAMAGLLSTTPSTSSSSSVPQPTPLFSIRCNHLKSSNVSTGTGASSRRLGSLHVANARKNVPVERKGVTVSPTEPEMSAEELRAYEEITSQLEGTKPDFWEGPQFNALGFVLQWMWLFGVVVSIVACIVAVRTYNLGATDFKDTAVFKEAIEQQADDLVDDSSGRSVFGESNKEAP